MRMNSEWAEYESRLAKIPAGDGRLSGPLFSVYVKQPSPKLVSCRMSRVTHAGVTGLSLECRLVFELYYVSCLSLDSWI